MLGLKTVVQLDSLLTVEGLPSFQIRASAMLSVNSLAIVALTLLTLATVHPHTATKHYPLCSNVVMLFNVHSSPSSSYFRSAGRKWQSSFEDSL